MVAAEALPFSKTGGLADVAGALPAALARMGHRVTLVTPRYRGVGVQGAPVARLVVPLGAERLDAACYQAPLGGGATAILVDRPDLFDRDFLYGQGSRDYADNARRFAFLARAALEFAVQKGERVDVVHAHDWQAGLAPVYLRTAYAAGGAFEGTACVFTVHNLAYQGLVDPAWLPMLGLGRELLTIDGLEYWGRASFLKGGINFADLVTTVSRRYAEEIRTPEFGCGFEGIVARCGRRLVGIPNGIDTEEWDPRHDLAIPARYDARSLGRRVENKRALAEAFGLPADRAALARPLVAMISRMVDQKGLDLIAAVSGELPYLGARFAIMGAGEPRYEHMWRLLAARYPDTIAVKVGFDQALSHLVHGGADLFMMPSRFEPCGLSQMYAQRYGNVPVVHATGGLDDTVEAFDPATGQGTGFKFREYSPEAFLGALRLAFATFGDRAAWRRLQRSGMARDFSWGVSAEGYAEVYRQAVLLARGPWLSPPEPGLTRRRKAGSMKNPARTAAAVTDGPARES